MYHTIITMQGLRGFLKKMNRCAKKIQQQWKVHRRRQLQERIMHRQENKATIKLQKYLRGFVVAKEYEPVYVKMRLTDNIEHFKGVR